jgi:hypothetical protein
VRRLGSIRSTSGLLAATDALLGGRSSIATTILKWIDPDWVLDVPRGSGPTSRAALSASMQIQPFAEPVIDPQLFSRMPTLHHWARRAARAAGFEPTEITTAHPLVHADDPGVVVCVGFGLVLRNPQLTAPVKGATSHTASLVEWAATKGIDRTAFAALTGGDDVDVGNDHGDPHTDTGNPTRPASTSGTSPIRSPLPLDGSQRRVLQAVRDRSVVAVSGPPGTGKSHTVIALAMDAVSRGQSVLIATRSIEAVDVLVGQLAAQPGPVPIRFGSREAREASLAEIERRLADHEPAAMGHLAKEAADTLDAALAAVTERLDRVRLARRYRDLAGTVAGLADAVPRCFDDDADLDHLAELARLAGADGHGVVGSWHHRSARHHLADAVDCDAEPAVVTTAVEAARARRAAADLTGCEGELRALWDDLEHADREHRHWLGRQLDESVLARAEGSDGRAALSTIRAALLSGEKTRRQVMGGLDPRHLALAAPLWLGTLAEIDSLLPHQPGLFDLVIIDEASQVDQAIAAPALLRARRAAIFGDPRQLSHLSFVKDADQSFALLSHGLEITGARFDLRRTSQLDAAAIASPVIWLSEHHRSVPHLIGFSLAHFYDRRVTLASRHPANETLIAIDVIRSDEPTASAVVQAVSAVVADGASSIGVVTPFRNTADAIEAEIRRSLKPAELEAAHVRVGTVHSFQGAERDVMVVVPDLAGAEVGSRRRFVEDPHLFNVMVTRARTHMVLVVPDDGQPDGLLADFLTWAATAPPAEPSHDPTSVDAAQVAVVLTDSGLIARTSYPVGNWSVDVCAGVGKRAAGVMVGCHPDGPIAHVDRHLALARSGWRLIDPVIIDDDADGGPTVRSLELVRDLSPPAGGSAGPDR